MTLAPETNGRKSIVVYMANKSEMEPQRYEQTLRATAFPGNGSPEQFAAFLVTCRNYDLDPLKKEIYAWPDRGRIVVMVSVDGWLTVINRQPAFDGMEFEHIHDQDGRLTAVTCTMHRKDRTHPIRVTEYLDENWRDTQPWKMPHRMLRHRAMIQCARYCFGFGDISEQDEVERWINRPSAIPAAAATSHPGPQSPRPRPVPPPPPPPRPEPPPPPPADPGLKLARFEAALREAETVPDCDRAWIDIVEPMIKAGVLTRTEQEEAEARMRERCGPLMENNQDV